MEKKVLVVDDIKQNRYLLQKLLEGYGYSVETASNGVEALEKVWGILPDMIITDVLMPGMDGFQLCRTLKNDEKLKDIPVLFYSATYVDKKSQDLAFKIGAENYIIKPIEPDDFIKIIEEISDKYRKSELKPPEKSLEEPVYMKLYNDRLIQKLEKKIFDLEREISERKAVEEHVQHLNNVLNAIKSINQLIIVEKDRDTLVRKICDAILEVQGYDAAWLGFSEDGKTFTMVKGSGFQEDVSRFCEYVMNGDHPPCIRNVLARKDRLVVRNKTEECEDCFFVSACRDKETAIIRLEKAGRFFGLLVILSAPDVVTNKEEKGLIEEVTGNIVVALHNMEREDLRKNAEDRIKASLKEKEVMFLEIQHRVKNNLQIVSSLVNMQARAAKDKDIKDTLSESRNRINTMALIHSQLYESKNLSEVNMKGFVNNLVRQLLQVYSVQDTRITPNVSVADSPLPISIAVHVGLIINELLTNAFKHAFVNRNEGTIGVSIGVSEKGLYSLTVSDDGVGLPQGFNIDDPKTLGLRLVKILTEKQLQGTLEITSDGGTSFKMMFEIEDDESDGLI